MASHQVFQFPRYFRRSCISDFQNIKKTPQVQPNSTCSPSCKCPFLDRVLHYKCIKYVYFRFITATNTLWQWKTLLPRKTSESNSFLNHKDPWQRSISQTPWRRKWITSIPNHKRICTRRDIRRPQSLFVLI